MEFIFKIPWPIWAGTFGILAMAFALLTFKVLRDHFFKVFRPARPSNQPALPYMDGLRGLLALQVALFHSWQWMGGNSGRVVAETFPFLVDGGNAVAIFVAISGFFIFRSVSGSRGALKNYFLRRLLRTYPLFFVTTVFIHLGGWIADGSNWQLWAADLLATQRMRWH